MLSVDKRRSDRIELELRIQLSGVDAAGRNFTEQTRTQVVSRHGAQVLSNYTLSPQQSVTLWCYRTGVEAAASVVGQFGRDSGPNCYSLGLAGPDVDMWGIDFPPMDEVGRAAGRVLLECQTCTLQEVAHLDAVALEVLVANDCLLRPCRHCSDRRVTVWKRASLGEKPLGTQDVSSTRSIAIGRRQVSIQLATEVCLRCAALGPEIAITETVWCGGFRFKSPREYGVGAVLEAALPFSDERASVFSPVRILSAEEVAGEAAFSYSVGYLRNEHAPWAAA